MSVEPQGCRTGQELKDGTPIYPNNPTWSNMPPWNAYVPPLCEICGSTSRNPPHPLDSFQLGRQCLEVCHVCLEQLNHCSNEMVNGIRRINGLEARKQFPPPKSFGGNYGP